MLQKTKKQYTLVLISKDTFIFSFPDNTQDEVLPMPETVIHHGEIVDADRLAMLLSDSLSAHDITPDRLAVFVDESLTYEKPLTGDLISQEKLTKEFTDIVPLEETQHKIYRLKQKTLVVTMSKSFYTDIRTLFEQQGFSLFAFVPKRIVEMILGISSDKVDMTVLRNKLDFLKHYSFTKFSDAEEKLLTYDKPEIKSPRFIILLSVFILLFGFLMYFTYTQIFATPSKQASHASSATKTQHK